MEKIAIITDAGGDIETIEESLNWDNLFICRLYINFGSDSYKSNELTSKEFFEKVSSVDKKNFPKTAAASPGDFMELFDQIKAKGFTHLIYIAVASKLSATINSARMAVEDYEGMEIAIVDSQTVSLGQLGLVFKAKQYMDQSMSFKDIVSKLEVLGPDIVIFASLTTLENLVKGGRMSPVRYFLGNLLKIKPVLRINQGEVHPFEKTKGIENSRNSAFGHGVTQWTPSDNFIYYIGHGNNEELAKEYERKLKSEYPKATGRVVPIGPIIGTHTGQDSFLITTFPAD